jgi:hypothetical protein
MTNQFSSSIICLIENSNDVNISIYNQDEEEENSKETKESKELKSDFISNNNFDFTFLSHKKSSKVDDFYLISEYKATTSITILPPEQV